MPDVKYNFCCITIDNIEHVALRYQYHQLWMCHALSVNQLSCMHLCWYFRTHITVTKDIYIDNKLGERIVKLFKDAGFSHVNIFLSCW